MEFTAENRPICVKCKEKPAITLMDSNIWVCGQCIHEYIQKLNEQKREIFLKG